MRSLKVLVGIMGVLLVAGSVVLVVAVVGRIERKPAQSVLQQAASPLRTVLPEPGRIVATDLSGDRLLVRVALADGGEELVLFNARDGAEVAVIELPAAGPGKAVP
ncbi:MAG TPA: hypothetical protein VMU87_09465 [Stellaceae bacterium]|nr:hypothetical protein [Stellaceae bacterium]